MDKVMKDCFACLVKTNEEEFQMSMQMMAQDLRFAQMMMAARQGKLQTVNEPTPNAAPILELQTTLVALETSNKL